MEEFPSNVWVVRHFEPPRAPQENQAIVTDTIVVCEGFMRHPLGTPLTKSILQYAKHHNLGCLIIATKELNGRGPLQELANVKFGQLLESLVRTLMNSRFGFSHTNKIILTGFSYGGWMALCVALRQELKEWLDGCLLLAPALGCFLPFYQDNLLRLELMDGREEQVEQLNQGRCIRLDQAFGPIADFPMSGPFQQSSWAYSLKNLTEGPQGNLLAQLTTPISLIVGEDDERVKPSDVENLYKKLPRGNKRLLKVDSLQHSFDDPRIFASIVRPELDRLRQDALPNIAFDDEEDMEGLSAGEWMVHRKPLRKKTYLHLRTGQTYWDKVHAVEFEQKINAAEDNVETKLIFPQTHAFDLPQPDVALVE